MAELCAADKPKVFLALPSRDGWMRSAFMAALDDVRENAGVCVVGLVQTSLLANGFNKAFCGALNGRDRGITHFLLVHADVVPQGRWFYQMCQDMARFNLDVLSAVITFRNDTGKTSTAIEDDNREPHPYYMHRDAGYGDDRLVFPKNAVLTSREQPKLLINTGCLLMNITRPWADEFSFMVGDLIGKNKDGKFEALNEPEDWRMSRHLMAKKVPYGATSKVHVIHHGTKDFLNWEPTPEEVAIRESFKS